MSQPVDMIEWIEEALSYVGSDSWSPSLHREGVVLLASLKASRDKQRAAVASSRIAGQEKKEPNREA